MLSRSEDHYFYFQIFLMRPVRTSQVFLWICYFWSGGFSFDDLEPYLGRGRMPVLETVYLSELLELNKNELELVAWSQQQDGAFGCDRFVLMTSILR